MTLVVNAAAAGTYLNYDTLQAQLSYGPGVTREAIKCSIGFLKRHGMVTTKNHGKRGAEIIPTAAGYELFKAKPLP